MIEVALGAIGKGRVWFGDLPPAVFPCAAPITKTVPALGATQRPTTAVAVELFVPTGPRARYGLLGAHLLRPRPGAEIGIEVFTTTADGEKYADSLAGSLDVVRVGLPREFADSVMEGALNAGNEAALGPCVLRFDHAAHGEIGSSPSFFGRLARAVVRLVAIGPLGPTDERLVATLRGS